MRNYSSDQNECTFWLVVHYGTPNTDHSKITFEVRYYKLRWMMKSGNLETQFTEL